jgi:shikimate kinase
MLIFIIGFMGSGKSHCGKTIAAYFQVPFVDLDSTIEEREKSSIRQLFDTRGETEFRKIESSVLREMVNEKNTDPSIIHGIVACGGGTPCYHENIQFMNQHGLTVWLDPILPVLLARLEKGKAHRPLIAGLSTSELELYIKNKIFERTPFYKQARLHYQGDDCPIDLIKNHLSHA